MNTPSDILTLGQIKALDGRIFATLTDTESNVLKFYRDQGRKYDVSVTIINKADPVEVARARSSEQADAIMKRANSLVNVVLGEDAAHALAAEKE
ncbi:hypothetical protein [Variovorax gossypii]